MPEPESAASSSPRSHVKGASIGVYNGVAEFDRKLASLCEACSKHGFEFICYHVGGNKRASLNPLHDLSLNAETLPEITVIDKQMTSDQWGSFVCGRLSPWIDVDSAQERISALSTLALNQELDYAMYLGLRAVMITLKHDKCPKLAQILKERFWTLGMRFRVWIELPTSRAELTNHQLNGLASGDQSEPDLWNVWRDFRTQVFNHELLAVCLRLTADLDDEFMDKQSVGRWLGEPIASLWLDKNLFITANDRPVLSVQHKTLVQRFIPIRPQLVISGAAELSACRRYSDDLYRNHPRDLNTPVEGYEDHLQTPLQPLSDNLDSSTYETFEKDPVKYVQYEKAISRVLLLMSAKRRTETNLEPRLVVMVLGAGRGPLVTAVIKAQTQLAIDDATTPFSTKVYAVEKNKNALVTLNYLKETQWGENVTVVGSDMRHFEPEEKADIIVSELLGSFGDNELSPECLDGAMQLLKEDAVSIPSSYRSYVAPVHSVKLTNIIRSHHDDAWHENLMRRAWRPPQENPLNLPAKELEGFRDRERTDLFDQPYVVKLNSHHLLADPKTLFTFNHPNLPKSSNERKLTLTFEVGADCEIMGFAGYFDCTLFEDIYISIVPSTHSLGMFSWFPVLLPLREPLTVAKDEQISVQIERKVDDGGVWYEWQLLGPQKCSVQNVGARSYYMRLG